MKKTTAQSTDNWTDDELRAAVVDYLDMLALHRKGESFNKQERYRELARRFGRTTKAWEYRAQNISHVLDLAGRAWLPGLKPQKNVGPRNLPKIASLLDELEGTNEFEAVWLDAEVSSDPEEPPAGSKSPSSKSRISTSYDRDRGVKVWVLANAAGRCEACGCDAPFLKHNGVPFLEVHHLHRLADGGPDIVENAVALCPNCHRAFHYSVNRAERVQELKKAVSRLRDDVS